MLLWFYIYRFLLMDPRYEGEETQGELQEIGDQCCVYQHPNACAGRTRCTCGSTPCDKGYALLHPLHILPILPTSPIPCYHLSYHLPSLFILNEERTHAMRCSCIKGYSIFHLPILSVILYPVILIYLALNRRVLILSICCPLFLSFYSFNIK